MILKFFINKKCYLGFLLGVFFLIIFLFPEKTLFFYVFSFLLLNLFVLVPFYLWLGSLIKKDDLHVMDHPSFGSHLSLGIIYPGIWLIYFSLVRFFRMGDILDLSAAFFTFCEVSFFIFFCLPSLFFWFLLIVGSLREIKEYLEELFFSAFYGFHLFWLQNRLYFRFFYALHKLRFFLVDIFISQLSSISYEYYPRKGLFAFTSFLFYHSYLMTVLFFFSICLEFWVTGGKIFYGVYLMFFYPFIRAILHTLNAEVISHFIRDVCKSDYIFHNWLKPRFPSRFWIFNKNPLFFYDLEIMLDPKEDILFFDKLKAQPKEKSRWTLLMRCWGMKKERFSELKYKYTKAMGLPYPWRIPYIVGKPRSFTIRFAAAYLERHDVRWMMTLKSIHPATPLCFTRDIYSLVHMAQSPSVNFAIVQQCAKSLALPSSRDIYVKIHKNVHIPNEPKNILEFAEINNAISFTPLAENGVVVGTFPLMKRLFGVINLERNQAHCDTLLQFRGSSYPTQDYLGIDHKHKNVTHLGRNQMVTPDPAQTSYDSILKAYTQGLEGKFIITKQQKKVLAELQESQNIFERHQDVWVRGLHFFPRNWRPPLFMETSFRTEYLHPDVLEVMREAEQKVQSTSKVLFEKKIPFPESSKEDYLKDFENSYIQEIMK